MQRLLPLFLLLSFSLTAQTDMTGVELEGATALRISANFSQVDIRQSDGDAITIEHTVIMEGEAHPELAKLEVERKGQLIEITEVGPTLKQLEALQKGNRNRNNCCNSEINMIVRVPAGVEVTVTTIYGSVTVTELPGLREVDATYGGVTVIVTGPDLMGSDLKLYSNYGAVDLTLPADAAAKLELKTQYGELLTDLDIKIDEGESERRDFYERVVGTVGSAGKSGLIQCEAPYGKVYLRQGS